MTKSFRQQVLQDTKNSAIAYSDGRVAFVEYHDHSEEFILFLRAALLVTDREIPDKVNRRRTWRSVADYNGLVARSLRSKRSRTTRTKFGPRERVFSHPDCTKNEARAKKRKEWGGGGKRRERFARKHLDFEKRSLVFTVELFND